MEDESRTLELVAKGCIGTCWYGKYHYVEPWVGCGHGCLYCYARFRDAVRARLIESGTAFEKPAPLHPAEELPRRLLEAVTALQVSVVKLCRFTDIFSPAFVSNGLSFDVLQALLRSPAQRIIVTTKGVPDARISGLICANKERFSYNAAVRPDQSLGLEPGLRPVGERLAAAERMSRAGVKTTIHLDPVIAGVDDDPEVLGPFLKKLKRKGLGRAMFSYLHLRDDIVGHLKGRMSAEAFGRLIASFDMGHRAPVLPGQADTTTFATRPDLKRRSVDAFAKLLRQHGMDFVLCSLKSSSVKERKENKECPVCDGTFYA